MRPIRFLLAVSLGLISVFAQAEIRYHVEFVPEQVGGKLHVTMTVPCKDGKLDLRSPVWAPGAYALGEFGKSIEDFSATDASGKAVPWVHPDFSTWLMVSAPGTYTINYFVPIGIQSDIVHFGGIRTYLYANLRKDEKCALTIKLPAGWKIANGLDADSGKENTELASGTPAVKDSEVNYSAPTYDVLADTPTTMGKFLEEDYTAHGKPHRIVLYGAGMAKTDQPTLLTWCKNVSEIEGTFFGEVPYKQYIWHFSVNDAKDGAGGLEHLNGTEIGLASGVGPRAQGVLFHEFFHLWNVKRIRSSVLGPFDYTKLPETGALWWLEGVTDYYAHTLPVRYGVWDSNRLLADIGSNITSTDNNPARMVVSPYDSSFKVDKSADGRGNSNGLQVSYYNTGWLLGMMLDIEIRDRSKGKHSLDDVELALWNECKNNQPGFPEDEIRTLCVKFGGKSLGEFYDKWVMNPGDLPVKEELEKVGILLDSKVDLANSKSVTHYSASFNPAATKEEIELREAWMSPRKGTK